jgi:hypothetical protein
MNGQIHCYAIFDSFGKFVIMKDYKKFFLVAIILLGVFSSSNAQHYFFIEADNQQAFYIKKSSSIYSSSANGFLIIPRNTEKTFTITVGFPMNKYPELNFNLDEMDRDKGFQLKNFQEKGWGLFDRASSTVIMQSPAEVKVVESNVSKPQSEGGDFANMLSDVTDDKTLLTKGKNVLKAAPKNADSKLLTKPVKPASKPEAKSNQPVKTATTAVTQVKPEIKPHQSIQSTTNTITKVKVDSSEKGILSIKYIDKSANGKADVVDLKIEVPSSQVAKSNAETDDLPNKQKQVESTNLQNNEDSSKLNSQSSGLLSPSICTFPKASEKDIKNIQRKLLGYAEGDEQLDFAEKGYKNKCFTTNQTMEISWFLLNEDIRLAFFKRIVNLIADQENIKLLESGFVKEDNIKSYREFISTKF